MPEESTSYDPLYLKGIEYFNVCDFFEAHETWEELWTEYRGPARQVLPRIDPGSRRAAPLWQWKHPWG